ncbi:MAG: glycosyltransferase family 4 protein [Lautropia sp.]
MPSSLTALAAALALACATSWLLCRALVHWATPLGLLDRPNDRSSHRVITPRGGGAAIVAAFALAAPLALPAGWLTAADVKVVGAAALLVAVIGLIDDVRNLGATVRLAMQAIAVVALGYALRIAAAPAEADSGWIGLLFGPAFAGRWLPVDAPALLIAIDFAVAAALVLAALWWLNAYNFMDGIDGLAAAQALFMLGASLLIEDRWIATPADRARLVLIAAVLGFLWWNRPPARLFMGDCGSLFLAFAVLAFGGHGVTSGDSGVWIWLILGGMFVCDASVTLLRRLLTGQNVLAAHRSHAYQRLARRWRSHARVTLVYSAVNLAWLLPLAALARVDPARGAALCAVAWAPLAAAAWLLGAGKKEEA